MLLNFFTKIVSSALFDKEPIFHNKKAALSSLGKSCWHPLATILRSHLNNYSASSFFLPGTTNPNPARIALAAAPKIANSLPVPVFGNSRIGV